MEIKISGADVAIPIKKKLAIKPEIESFFENSSVDVIRRFAPYIRKTSPINKNKMASIIVKPNRFLI